MISLLDEKYGTLQDVFEGLRTNPDGATDAFQNIYPITAGENPEENKVMRRRLVQLFINALSKLPRRNDDGEYIPNSSIISQVVYPVPGEPNNDLITPEDIQIMIDALSRVLPEPEDPNFLEAIADRTAGMVRFLGTVVTLHNRGRDTGATIRNVRMASRPDDKTKTPLNKIPWAERQGMIGGRNASMQKSLDTSLYRTSNSEQYEKLEEQYGQAGLEEVLTLVRNAFEKGKKLFAKGDKYKGAQWTAVLYGRLQRVDFDNPQTTKEEVTRLAHACIGASSEEEFRQALDEFKPSN